MLQFNESYDSLAVNDENDVSKLKFVKMLEKLTSLNQITAKFADDAKDQFSKLIEEVVPEHRESFMSFDKFDRRLDTFFAEFLLEKGFESLWRVFTLIFCLSHGQSAIEREFKTNKEFITENQSEGSLKSLRIIQDYMMSNEVQANNLPITREMVKSVNSARSRYVEFQTESLKSKVDTRKDLKRKAVCSEIEEVRKKKQYLQTSINALIKDADELALKAETTSDFQALGQSNDLRKLANSKKEEVEECIQMEQSLVLRKDSVV